MKIRGSAMLMTMMILAGLVLLSAGILIFAANVSAGAHAMRKRTQLANCALAVRQYLVTQLRFPSSPTLQTLDFKIPGPSGQKIEIEGGHIGQPPTPSISGFRLAGAASSGVAAKMDELGNNIKANPGGASTTGAATCTDFDGNSYEVEFSFSFGV